MVGEREIMVEVQEIIVSKQFRQKYKIIFLQKEWITASNKYFESPNC